MAKNQKIQNDMMVLIQRVPWVQALTPEVFEIVSGKMYETSHQKSEVIVRMGDPSDSWIFCADGLLKISATDTDGRVIMYTGVPQGGWIGEGAVIKQEVRRYDIVSLRESRLLHVPSETFRWLMAISIEFNHFIIEQLNERLSQYISMVEIDRLQNPVARVAKSLAALFNPVLYPSMSDAVPLSQQEIGELSGLSRQSVNVAIKLLKANGSITTDYGVIKIKNLAALKNFKNEDYY